MTSTRAAEQPVYVAMTIGPSRLGIGLLPPDERHGPGRRATLWLYVDDVDKAVLRLRADDVAVVSEPADQPWGERMAELTDPDGTQLYIASRQRSSCAVFSGRRGRAATAVGALIDPSSWQGPRGR